VQEVIDEGQLIAAVDRAFAVTGRGLEPWPDPHPERSPPAEAYSRLLDPGKWRIIGARAEAWMAAVVEAAIATVERDASIRWRSDRLPILSRTDRVVPDVPGGLPLIVGRSQLGDVDDAGVVLGVGDPTVCVEWFPDCGCDACDSGSQNELDWLDEYLLSIVSGRYRWLTDGVRTIFYIGEEASCTWGASGEFVRGEVERVLTGPTGWEELSGPSWLAGGRPG
jgi:hypothetical protein